MVDMSWLNEQYAERKLAAESHVTRWVPYTDQAYAVDPLHFLLNRFPRGVPLDDAKGAFYSYGVDDAGLVWVERQGTEFEGRFYETFYVHGPSGPTELALFDYSETKDPVRHEVFTYEDGGLVTSEYQARGGCGRSRYFYEDDRLARVEQEHGDAPDHLQPYIQALVTYDEQGEISELRTNGNGGATEVAYRALPAGMGITDIEQAFLDRLVEALPAAVADNPPPVTPGCLALLYMPGQFSVLPPLPAFPVGEGLAGIAGLLNDADSHEIDIDRERAPELHDLAGFLDQIRLDDDRLRTLLDEAARRLNRLDWSRHLTVPDDFLVFATTYEQEFLQEHLRAVTTPERARQIFELTGLHEL